MNTYRVTTQLAAAMLDRAGHLPTGRFFDAAIRGALLIDATAARHVVGQDGRLHVSVTTSGFPPADALLVAVSQEADLHTVICRGSVGLTDVIAELVDRGWWARSSRSIWRPRIRYRLTDLLPALPDSSTGHVVDLIMAAADAEIDGDDVLVAARQWPYGAAVWILPRVLAELIEFRLWLQAVAATPVGGG